MGKGNVAWVKKRRSLRTKLVCLSLSFICNFPYLVYQDEPDQQGLGCWWGPRERSRSTCPSPSASTPSLSLAFNHHKPTSSWEEVIPMPGLQEMATHQKWFQRGDTNFGKTGHCSSPSPEAFQLEFNFLLGALGIILQGSCWED